MKTFLSWIKAKLTSTAPGGFQQGDKVSWGGCIGTVVATKAPGNTSLQVLFMGPKMLVGFYPDGRFLEWHRSSDLKFLARQRVKKQVKLNVEASTSGKSG